LNPLHVPFALAYRLVGLFGAIVQVAALHQDVQHSAISIHHPPQIMPLPIARQQDLIEMPRVA
jgi:hypothetical protein